MLQAITRRLKRGKRGISTVIVVMLSLVLIVIIVGNVVLWSYQMNQVDMDRIQETLSLTNVERLRSPWFTAQNEFSITAGSRLSGTYLDTKVLDGLHETFREEPQGFDGFNPSSCIPVGSTSYVSGSITDLSSNDGVYMNFRSYVSSSSATSQTDAFVAYRDSTATLNTPKERTWTGANATWGVQSALPTSGSPVRWVRVTYCPLELRSYEKIVVTLSDDGYLDAYVWNGTAWTATNDIGFVGTTENDKRPYDVVYESLTGRAMLVYGISSTDTTKDLAYRTWTFGIGWSAETTIDITTISGDLQARWVELASKPSSNEITLIASMYVGTTYYAVGWVWDGSVWGNYRTHTSTLQETGIYENIAVAYETSSGQSHSIFISAARTMSWARWSGSTWTSGTTGNILGSGVYFRWCTLKANPVATSSELMATWVTSNSALWTLRWDGVSAWAANPTSAHDTAVDTNTRRCADFEWEPTGSKGLLVWGTTAGQIAYRTYTSPSTWGTQQNPTMGTSTHSWVQLARNTRTVSGDTLILGLVLEATAPPRLGAIKWNGTAFTVIGASTISADVNTDAYESFKIDFMNFGTPVFTCAVELSGTANAQNWTQLEWTADLAFTTPNVTTTLQLYNFNASQYPATGDGYITDVIGQTDVTRNQTITTNSTYFRDSGNNWKIKITGIKMDTIPFELKIDWIRFKVAPSDVCRLDINNNFTIDLATYPRSDIYGIEIRIRYNVTGNGERWFLKAYNWATATFTDTGFNNTAGDAPTPNVWNDYAISVTANWTDYVRSDGVMCVEFSDEGLRTNQTIAEIDFLGARAIMDGTCISIKNSSPLSIHIVALWITNSTSHQRYDADLFLNSGESVTYIRVDLSLPQDAFTVKIVTERGNVAVFSSD
jgi:hypothetical protein